MLKIPSSKITNKQEQSSLTRLLGNMFEKPKPLVQETIEKKTELRTNADFVASLELAEVRNSLPIDIFTSYCVKTGAPIGNVNALQVQMLIELHGVENAKDLIAYGCQTSIARHWVMTSPQSLEKLAMIDPVGYFVFAASFAIQHRAEGYSPTTKKFEKNSIHEIAFLYEKVLLWQKLQLVPMMYIINANAAWRDYLSLVNPDIVGYKILDNRQWARANIVFPSRRLQDLGNAETVEALPAKLKYIISKLLYIENGAARRNKLMYSYSDLKKISAKYGTSIAFMNQIRMRGESEVEAMARVLDTWGWAREWQDDTFDMRATEADLSRNSKKYKGVVMQQNAGAILSGLRSAINKQVLAGVAKPDTQITKKPSMMDLMKLGAKIRK